MGKRGPKPKFTDIACPNNHCAYYGMVNAGNIVGNGTYQTKSRRVRKYICRECDAVFSDRNNTVFYDIRSEESKVVDACRLLVKGLSMRSAADFLHVKEETVSGWLSRAAEHCQEINDVLMKNLKVSKVELDEFWTFVQKKQLHLWRFPIPDPLEKVAIISEGYILYTDWITENVQISIKRLRYISQKTI